MTWNKVFLFALAMLVFYLAGEGAVLAFVRGYENWTSADYNLVILAGLLLGAIVRR